MTLITLVPFDQERDGGKGTREILSAMAEITQGEIRRGREEQREARRQMWERWMRPRRPVISGTIVPIVPQKYSPNQYLRVHYQNPYQMSKENLRRYF